MQNRITDQCIIGGSNNEKETEENEMKTNVQIMTQIQYITITDMKRLKQQKNADLIQLIY